MRYARSKNLTTYDVLIIASMIEREVQVPKERKLVAAVIYNRLHAGMPLQIDATIRYATEQLHQAASARPSSRSTRRTTPTRTRGCRPARSATRGSPRSRRRPTRRTCRYLYYVVKPNTCGQHTFATTKAEFDRAKAAYDKARAANGRQRADSRALRGLMRQRLAVLGQPISHSRSPAMQTAALAELGLAGEWSYEAIEVAPDDFEPRVRAMAAEGLRGRQRHRSAQARGARARRRGLRGRAGDRRRQHAQLHAPGGSQPRTPTPPGSWTRSPGHRRAGARWCWAPAARHARWSGRWSRAGAEVAIWNRTPERAAAPGRASSATAPELSRRRACRLSAIDLIVNATTVGMGDAAHGSAAGLKSLPLGADSLGETHQLVDLAYGSAETELASARERAAQRSSTGSRCWFARGPRRFGSGPGWNPRSRR